MPFPECKILLGLDLDTLVELLEEPANGGWEGPSLRRTMKSEVAIQSSSIY